MKNRETPQSGDELRLVEIGKGQENEGVLTKKSGKNSEGPERPSRSKYESQTTALKEGKYGNRSRREETAG